MDLVDASRQHGQHEQGDDRESDPASDPDEHVAVPQPADPAAGTIRQKLCGVKSSIDSGGSVTPESN
ncbi:hypothetical protein [Bradyrhizobium sp. AZCC 2230]|uniref:hypothetical protein n=1 Tax=Bradyrhizobium sp. AZCC 2230 TaxID=3117021 RepID=UPI002FF0D78D